MDAREETEFALFVVKCMNVGDDIFVFWIPVNGLVLSNERLPNDSYNAYFFSKTKRGGYFDFFFLFGIVFIRYFDSGNIRVR